MDFCFTNVSGRTLSYHRDIFLITNFKIDIYNMVTLAQYLGRVSDVFVSFDV